MSDNPAKIAELQNDKLVEILRSKNLGVPVCRHIESEGHNGREFVKPEYVIETFPSVEFLRSIKLLKAQIRTLVCVRNDLGVETSTVPYLEINNNASAAAASSSSSKTTTTTLTAEEAETLMQEAAPLFTTLKYSEAIEVYSKVVDAISMRETADATVKKILSRGLSNRSGCFLGLKKSQEALEDARKCVDVRPSWVRAHLRVAEAAEELKEFDVAISAYESAIKAEDQSGNVPSKKDLELKILRVNWMKRKPKSVKHSFWADLVAACGVDEADSRYLFSFFDQPITQFFNLTETDIAAIFGSQQQSKIEKVLHAKKRLQKDPLNFKKIVILEQNNTSSSSSSSASSVVKQKKVSGQTIRDFIESAQMIWASAFHAKSLPPDFVKAEEVIVTPKAGAITRDMFLFIAPFVSDPDTAVAFTESLGSMCATDENMFSFFCCIEIRDALIEMSNLISSSLGAKSWGCVFGSMYQHSPSHQKSILNTEKVRDIFISIVSKYAKNEESIYWVVTTISYLAEGAQELYAVPSVIDCLISCVQYANSVTSLFCILSAIIRTIKNNTKVAQQVSQYSQLKEVINNIIPRKLARISSSSSGGGISKEFVMATGCIGQIREMLSW